MKWSGKSEKGSNDVVSIVAADALVSPGARASTSDDMA